MSQATIETIKRGVEAWNRGDWDAALEGFAEDAVWQAFFAPVAGDRSLYGHAAIKRAWVAAADVFGGGGTYRADAREYRDLGGGTVLAVFKLSGRGTSSGIEIDTEVAQLWTVRDGLAVRVDSYTGVGEALEAVGLSD